MNKRIEINFKDGYFTATLYSFIPYDWKESEPQELENIRAKTSIELYRLIEKIGWYNEINKNI